MTTTLKQTTALTTAAIFQKLAPKAPVTGTDAVARIKAHNAVNNTRSWRGELLKPNMKKGRLYLGRDEKEIPIGTQVLVDIPTTVYGFEQWEDSSVIDTHKVLFFSEDEHPAKEDHSKLEGWREFFRAEVRPMDDPNSIMTISLSTAGNCRSFRDLLDRYAEEIGVRPNVLPIVSLDLGEFDAKDDKGRPISVFKLIFNIKDWYEVKEGETGDGEIAEAGGSESAAVENGNGRKVDASKLRRVRG